MHWDFEDSMIPEGRRPGIQIGYLHRMQISSCFFEIFKLESTKINFKFKAAFCLNFELKVSM